MKSSEIKQNMLLKGAIFPEQVQVVMTVPMGSLTKLICKGLETGKLHDPVLSDEQIAQLEIISSDEQPFDGDSKHFRIGIEALRLGLAYEYDPYFSLSIARVDPLPHQLEAVYDYFLKLPRIRFLLADDPGAGKTIMAGLLIKELKIRGLIKRVLIVAPANLSFQWQRELKDKFREDFKIINSSVLRANYGANPWQDTSQVITSVSWVSRIDDAYESLMRSHWDLVIVDEAHKMSAYSEDKTTLAYDLGKDLSERTDHYLLMTATPHKGDPKNFCLFLSLLDKDVYGDISSLQRAMEDRVAPFYLRRVKEALVTFPNPDTGEAKSLFTKRNVKTIPFQIDDDELDFYDRLTRYVEDQSIKASEDNSARGRALGFTMAMLQRRFASSVYAARRTLERMKATRENILKDPEAYRQRQLNKKIEKIEDFDERTEEEQNEILKQLEDIVADVDPVALKEDIVQLTLLIEHAQILEAKEIESKLATLKEQLTSQGVFKDPNMKLLLFTEHKDTLDYLAGDGKDGRPLGKLIKWGLSVTQIHGGMKIGDRDTPGTRLYAERAFKEENQILVATEAAGEGINLQFCWFMINYDIPWNFVRLEQRMGRIHRYLQEEDCLILNFVSIKTREGRVLDKIFECIERAENDLDPKKTGKVFNVIGEIFPANEVERMVREMYARSKTEEAIKARIVKDIDIERLRSITESTLEGLAKKELNLSVIVGKSEEAKERRLVPEVIEDFFCAAAPLTGISPKAEKSPHIYKLGRTPRGLYPYGEKLEPKFGKLGKDYKNVVFSKDILKDHPTIEWVTPGHALFECVRAMVSDVVQKDLQRGAVFYELQRQEPCLLDVFAAEIGDGLGNVLHKKLFVVQTTPSGKINIKQPTIFLDLSLAPKNTPTPDKAGLPSRQDLEQVLIKDALQPMLDEVRHEREREINTVSKHLEISMTVLIDKAQTQFAELQGQKDRGSLEQGLDGRVKMAEDRLDELNHRYDDKRMKIEKERQCTIGNIQHIGSAWVLPHPERKQPEMSQMISDPAIEKAAVDAVIAHEEARGWKVQSVESENRGFDLISRKPHPEDPSTAIEVRFIEVKGRAAIGEVALTTNEYKTADRLKKDFWLYVVFNCATQSEIHIIQDPVRLGWKPIVQVEHYHVSAGEILKNETAMT